MSDQDEVPAVVVQAGLASASATVPPPEPAAVPDLDGEE